MIRIPTPNTDRSLLTIAQLRTAVGLSATDGSRDAELIPMGNYISAMITKACLVVTDGAIPPTLRLERVVETVRPREGTTSFSLSRGPVADIVSFTERGTTLAADTDYELDGRTIFRLSGGQRCFWGFWPEFVQDPLIITYDAGYATVPDDLVYAAIKFVKSENSIGDRDPNLKVRQIEGVSRHEWWVSPPTDKIIPPEVMDILVSGGYVNRWGWML